MTETELGTQAIKLILEDPDRLAHITTRAETLGDHGVEAARVSSWSLGDIELLEGLIVDPKSPSYVGRWRLGGFEKLGVDHIVLILQKLLGVKIEQQAFRELAPKYRSAFELAHAEWIDHRDPPIKEDAARFGRYAALTLWRAWVEEKRPPRELIIQRLFTVGVSVRMGMLDLPAATFRSLVDGLIDWASPEEQTFEAVEAALKPPLPLSQALELISIMSAASLANVEEGTRRCIMAADACERLLVRFQAGSSKRGLGFEVEIALEAVLLLLRRSAQPEAHGRALMKAVPAGLSGYLLATEAMLRQGNERLAEVIAILEQALEVPVRQPGRITAMLPELRRRRVLE